MSTNDPSPGVVFDLDGVLIDSHDQHERSWFLLADRIGKPITREQFKASFGMRNAMCIPDVFAWADRDDTAAIDELGEQKEELYRQLLAEDGLEPLPGVVDLLSALRESGIPVSLGSSTSRKNIEVCFATTGLADFFGANYTGAEDVSHGKPHPEVFLKAAGKIDRSPESCVVIEDAHVGIEAALAGGMQAIAVTTTHSREALEGHGAALIVDSLAEVNPEVVHTLLRPGGDDSR